jgi:hypothetical protein
MTSNDVARWRNSREWLNGGECCGDKDSDGICAAPACIFGEAVKELQLAADRIEKLEEARDGAYTERNRLVAFIANIYPSGVKKTVIPGWDEAWHGCVYIDLPVGQASWHFHDSEAHLFAHLPSYEGEWDGHTTEEKYERLPLAANHAKQTDELLADYMKFADALMIQTNNQNKHIEKLEAALRDVLDNFFDSTRICDIARKALEGKDGT